MIRDIALIILGFSIGHFLYRAFTYKPEWPEFSAWRELMKRSKKLEK